MPRMWPDTFDVGLRRIHAGLRRLRRHLDGTRNCDRRDRRYRPVGSCVLHDNFCSAWVHW